METERTALRDRGHLPTEDALRIPTGSPEIHEGLIYDQTEREVVVYTGPDIEPIQVKVLGTFPSGTGDRVYKKGLHSLKKHPRYFFEEGEHSALIFGNSLKDPSAVYHLAVDREPLTWHKHPDCAHRIITVHTGSGGAFASFSLATEKEILENPSSITEKMMTIILPPDSHCLIRFNGSTYHQFGPRSNEHPAFIGISVHKNERQELLFVQEHNWMAEGHIDETTTGSIPLLTRYLPETAKKLLQDPDSMKSVRKFIL